MKKIRKAMVLMLVLVTLMSCLVVSANAANTGNQRTDIVNVAKAEVGNNNSNHRYRNDGYAWCASFVSFCARHANIPESIIKSADAACPYDFCVPFKYSKAYGGSYVPRSGDLIFFLWNEDVGTWNWSHVGIVESVNSKDGTVTTIEGNSSNKVRRITYSLSNGEIKGYGVPDYKDTSKSSYYLDLNGCINGKTQNNISGYATADVFVNGKKVAEDVADYYKKVPRGSTYKITDIRITNSNYQYDGKASYTGTVNSDTKIALPISKKVTSFSVNFRFKSGAYTNAFSDYRCLNHIGRMYNGDLITVKKIYSNGVAQLVCPWSENGKTWNRTIYVKIAETSFKATKYINAYSAVNGSKEGRVYPNDVSKILAITSNSGVTWLKISCPWDTGRNKIVYIKASDIY